VCYRVKRIIGVGVLVSLETARQHLLCEILGGCFSRAPGDAYEVRILKHCTAKPAHLYHGITVNGFCRMLQICGNPIGDVGQVMLH
jgi:hypothetical protein